MIKSIWQQTYLSYLKNEDKGFRTGINEMNRLTINEKCTYTISLKRFSTLRINSSSFRNRSSHSKKFYGSGTKAIVFSNEKLNDIMKIVKSPGESSLLIKNVSETVQKCSKRTKREVYWEARKQVNE